MSYYFFLRRNKDQGQLSFRRVDEHFSSWAGAKVDVRGVCCETEKTEHIQDTRLCMSFRAKRKAKTYRHISKPLQLKGLCIQLQHPLNSEKKHLRQPCSSQRIGDVPLC